VAALGFEPEPISAGKAELIGGPRLSAREGEGRVETGRARGMCRERDWVGGKKKRKGRERVKFSIFFEIDSNNSIQI